MTERGFSEADVLLLRAYRLLEMAGSPSVRLLQLSSAPDGSGPLASWAVTREHLLAMARLFQEHAGRMPPHRPPPIQGHA